MSKKLHIGELRDTTKSFLAKVLRIIIISFLILLGIIILKGILKKDELVLQPIHTPKYLHDAGYTGPYIAKKIHEEISKIYAQARTVREDDTEFNVDQSKDINMNVMGLGVSASNVVYHLRDLLGIQTNYISGNITDLENTLCLSLNMNNLGKSRTIKLKYGEGHRMQVLDSLIFEGAKFITEMHNPYRLAVFYNDKREDEKTLHIIRNLARNKEDRKWAYNLWGNLIKEKKGLEASLEYYDIALNDDPNFELAHRNKAWTYFNMEEYEKAESHFNTSLELGSSNPIGAMNGLAMCYERMGKIKEAKDVHIKNIAKNTQSIWPYRNYTEFLRRQEDTIEMKKVFDQAKAQSFTGPMYYMMMGGYYLYQEKLDSSLISFEKSLDLDPNNLDVLIAIFQISGGYAKEMKNDSIRNSLSQKAINTGRQMLPLFENSDYDFYMYLNVLNRLAIMEYEAGKIDSSLFHINKAIDLAPGYGLLYSTKAEVYAMQGDMEKFYSILEYAFQNGFEFQEEYFKDLPYRQLKEDARLLGMIKKYKKAKKKLKN